MIGRGRDARRRGARLLAAAALVATTAGAVVGVHRIGAGRIDRP